MQEFFFQGTSQQIGEQHGEALRYEIHHTIDLYSNLWRIPRADLATNVECFKQTIVQQYPHLAVEIGGIARGACCQEEEIYALNSRTELLGNVFTIQEKIQECTSIGIHAAYEQSNHVLLAQNWDWLPAFANAFVADICPIDKPRMKLFLEPGMVGKIGLNDWGIGVCLNFLPTAHVNSQGVPVHILLRLVVEQPSFEQARSVISTASRAASANYLLGSADDSIASLETTSRRVHEIVDHRHLVHTNSYDALQETCPRLQKVNSWLAGQASYSHHHLQQVLTMPGVHFPVYEFIEQSATLNSLILDLTEAELHVSENSTKNTFSKFGF